MAKMTAKKLLARDKGRNIGEELLQAVREMKAGNAAREHRIDLEEIAQVRERVGLSQPKFAEVLGVSLRTLQEWEQGRRTPSGAAQSLLKIAARRPDVLREVFAE